MFSKTKNESRNEAEQREQYEYARERILQKKRLLSLSFQNGSLRVVGASSMAFATSFLGMACSNSAIILWGHKKLENPRQLIV